MEGERGQQGTVNAEQWLQRNQKVTRSALDRAGIRPQDVSDTIIDDPSRAVEIARLVVEEARTANAPASVVQEMESSLQNMTNGLEHLPRYEYARSQIAQNRRKGKPEELEAALEEAATRAPDQANREKLQSIVSMTRMRRMADGGDSQAARMNWGCCVFVGALCFSAGAGGGAVVCCALALLLC